MHTCTYMSTYVRRCMYVGSMECIEIRAVSQSTCDFFGGSVERGSILPVGLAVQDVGSLTLQACKVVQRPGRVSKP